MQLGLVQDSRRVASLPGDKLQLQRSYKIHSARVKVSRVDYFLLIVQSNIIKRGASGANQRQLRPTTSLQPQQQQQQGEKHKQKSWRFIAFICTIYSYNILLIFAFASRVGHTWGRTRPHIIIIQYLAAIFMYKTNTSWATFGPCKWHLTLGNYRD